MGSKISQKTVNIAWTVLEFYLASKTSGWIFSHSKEQAGLLVEERS